MMQCGGANLTSARPAHSASAPLFPRRRVFPRPSRPRYGAHPTTVPFDTDSVSGPGSEPRRVPSPVENRRRARSSGNTDKDKVVFQLQDEGQVTFLQLFQQNLPFLYPHESLEVMASFTRHPASMITRVMTSRGFRPSSARVQTGSSHISKTVRRQLTLSGSAARLSLRGAAAWTPVAVQRAGRGMP
ncbi:hypothetical protein CALCODRAFT_201811 [Calocera cornea HHB12733]|uniref:Uncharacterized protein n=1 Tax=Calocera cornea HHB12733 TaxID=1353952 RepID=A0A165C3I3_9BASI|nr:hypothetical protein CALCODRAFT_201811 [Calocera cornea HHB12733]